MRAFRFTEKYTLALAFGLFAMLLALAALQYRWTGEISRAEREQLRAGLATGAERLAADLDHQLAEIFLLFQLQPGRDDAQVATEIASRTEHWRRQARFPDLIVTVFVVRRGHDGSWSLLRLSVAGDDLQVTQWPSSLASIRRAVAHFGPGAGPPPLVAGDVPALIVPFRRAPGEPPGPPDHGDRPRWVEAAVVMLDPTTIREEILPELVGRYFPSSPGSPYRIVIATKEPNPVILYRSSQEVSVESIPDSDVRIGLFELRPDGPPPSGAARHTLGALRSPRRLFGRWPGEGGRAQGAWQMAVSHPSGSVNLAVEEARMRNLALSFGILLVLGLAIGVLLVSLDRAGRLARQQLEFVAGVSHELHTPLAAIRSAADNLAEGVVSEPEQVRRYGDMIRHEGRRLSSMIGSVMEFAGMQSGRVKIPKTTVSMNDVVRGAVAAANWSAEREAATIVLDLQEELPKVMGNTADLQRAIQNLIENAMKYGTPTREVTVATRGSERDTAVRTMVSDRGSGIDRRDLPHIFEPFFRGRNATSAMIRGSGLGLSLVREIVDRHGGRIDIASDSEGTKFTISLPAVVDQQIQRDAEPREVEP